MYIANAAVENIGRVLDPGPIAYGFQYRTRGLNINQAGIASVFQEMGHRCAVSGGTGILYKTTKYGEGVYLSDLGERKYGDWLVLWQAPKPSDEEPSGGRFYMSVQERGEEEAELTIYGAEVFELLEEQGVTYTPGTMRIGVVEDAGISGGLVAIPAVSGGFTVTAEQEVSSLFVGGYQLPSLHVFGDMTGLPLPWIQLPTYERLIERIDRVGYRTDPVLKGKGIPVWAIVAYVLDLDLSYEEVVSDWEGEISVDEVKAAMEYYQAHPEEIEQKRRWASPR